MFKTKTLLALGMLSLFLAQIALAEESKVQKMTSDQTQAKYQRKSMTYIGITTEKNVNIPSDNLALAEKAIRNLIELKRFDYNSVNLSNVFTIDQFIQELRAFVAKVATDRAAAEAEYSERFKRANVLFTDIERIMNSAYFYTINVMLYREERMVCPDNALAAALLKCVPGTAGVKVDFNATATFYKANLQENSQPPYTLIKTVSGPPTASFEGIEAPPKLPPGATGAVAEAFQQALAAYNQRLPNLQRDAALKGTTSAASSLAEWLSKEMKKIPDFQLLTPVTGALSDGVEFMLGKEVGLGLDDTYDVTEFDAGGQKNLLGYVKVRDIGEAKGTGDGSPSYAEKVKEKRSFVGGELMIEHPMIGLAIGVHGVLEMALKDVRKSDDDPDNGLTMYPGFGFYVDKDIANIIKWPESYLSLEGDLLFLGSEADYTYMLIHGMLGLKKKWYINSLVTSLGIRGGISYYKISTDSGTSYEGNSIGFGGDVVLGLEYYVIPEFSIYLKAAGRIFTNPLEFGSFDFPLELGLNASLGVFLAF